MTRRREPDLFGEIRSLGLSYPEACEDHPWGETALKVRGKVFCFMTPADRLLTITLKLPESAGLALAQPGVTPTRHGMGASGWVTGAFSLDDPPPLPMLEAWLDESYRAVAPKRLVATLAGYSPGVSGDATMEGR
jgi:predicted DNA-binding protein (MmcQ/YjbR family)